MVRRDPGAGGIQHLTRLMGGARALEVMLSADDYDADLAERYGWISRAARRRNWSVREIARASDRRLSRSGPRRAQGSDQRYGLAPPYDFRRDLNLFVERRASQTQRRIRFAMERGFQTHDGEMALPTMVGDLAEH